LLKGRLRGFAEEGATGYPLAGVPIVARRKDLQHSRQRGIKAKKS
jgi:hypothetical protein